MSQTITPGQEVTYQDAPYVVRAVDGNVLELAYQSGGFFRLVHVTSVTVCTPPATQTAASLDAPAAGQGEGSKLRHKLLQDGAPGSHRWRCACGQWSAETPAKGPYGRTTMRARIAQLNMAYAKHLRFAEARA